MSSETFHSNQSHRKSVAHGATDDSTDERAHLDYHYQQGGRYFLEDPDTGEKVNVARLTAYADVGEDVYDKVVHHEIPLLKVDAPRFLDVLTQEEHAEYHQRDPDPVDVDDFPLLREGHEPE